MSYMNEIALRVKQEELKEQDIRLNKLCFDYQEKEKQIEIDAEHIRALQKQNGELTDKAKELEEKLANADYQLEGRDNEIAELKDKLNKIERKCKFNFVDLLHDVENESKQEEQLTKAKEILEKLVNLEYAINPPVDKIRSLMVKAEQFLKGEDIILEDAQAGNSPFDADEVFHKEMKAYSEEK